LLLLNNVKGVTIMSEVTENTTVAESPELVNDEATLENVNALRNEMQKRHDDTKALIERVRSMTVGKDTSSIEFVFAFSRCFELYSILDFALHCTAQGLSTE